MLARIIVAVIVQMSIVPSQETHADNFYQDANP